MYIIECPGPVELYDGEEMVAKAEHIQIAANEYRPSDWYGTMAFDLRSDRKKLAALKNRLLTAVFQCDKRSYRGTLKVDSEPVNLGDAYRVGFRGVHVLQVR